MYSWIWRHLPGSRALKLLQALVLIGAVLVLLMLVVFPWVEPQLPFNAVTAG
jgi:FlaA1/EpsC-like NDP-sugar epimerase